MKRNHPQLASRVSLLSIFICACSSSFNPLISCCWADHTHDIIGGAGRSTPAAALTVDRGASRSKLKRPNKSNGGDQMATIYEFREKTLDGKEIDFSTYKGSVLLIVNTASMCGFTPQYKGLEALHVRFAARGLKLLGFPCNQFGDQEPGDSRAIGDFCQKNYGVTFQMFEKIDVNGKNANPLYKYLTSAAPGVLGSEAIKWNFTKFLVDRKGNVVHRFAPNVEPEAIAPEIEKLL